MVCKKFKLFVDFELNSKYQYWRINRRELNKNTVDDWLTFCRLVETIRGLDFIGYCGEELIIFLKEVSEHHQELKQLNVRLCFLCTDDNTVVQLKEIMDVTGDKLKRLSFNLTGCEDLTDVMLEQILYTAGGKLERLQLNETEICGAMLDMGDNTLENLQYLDFSLCHDFIDEGLENIVRSTGGQLVELILFNTSVTGENFDVTEDKLKRLQYLDLKQSFATDRGLVKMINTTGGQLEKLRLSETGISGKNFKVKKNKMTQLKSLGLHGCIRLTNVGLMKMINSTGGQLVYLNLRGTEIRDVDFHVKDDKLKQLKYLYMNLCTYVSDERMVNIINCTGGLLEDLNLKFTAVSGDQFDVAEGKLERLKCLSLEYCDKLTKKGLAKIVNSTGGHLVSLNLSKSRMSKVRSVEDLQLIGINGNLLKNVTYDEFVYMREY